MVKIVTISTTPNKTYKKTLTLYNASNTGLVKMAVFLLFFAKRVTALPNPSDLTCYILVFINFFVGVILVTIVAIISFKLAIKANCNNK